MEPFSFRQIDALNNNIISYVEIFIYLFNINCQPVEKKFNFNCNSSMSALWRLFYPLLLSCHFFWIGYSTSIFEDDVWRVEYTSHVAFQGIRNMTLLLRTADKDAEGVHSCYDYRLFKSHPSILINWDGAKLENKTTSAKLYRSGSFCYPSVIITGMKKCSTSALYGLLEGSPLFITGKTKENCPFIGDRSIMEYFDSLPSYVPPGHFLLDGCIDLRGNIIMRKMLKEPNTFYLVLTRNFADWIWSAYNYWCDPVFDAVCGGGNWAMPGVNNRSSSYFHEIVSNSMNGKYIPSPLHFQDICSHGNSLFQGFVNLLWSHTEKDSTMILASEELEIQPLIVWQKIASALGITQPHPEIEKFQKMRYNTQVQSARGADVTIAIDEFKPGVYEISNYEPLWSSTRAILDQCWINDCIWVSKETNFPYPVCRANVSISTDINKELPPVVYPNGSIESRYPGYLRRKARQCHALSSVFNSSIGYKYSSHPLTAKDTIFITSRYQEDIDTVLDVIQFASNRRFGIPVQALAKENKCSQGILVGITNDMLDYSSGSFEIRKGFPCEGLRADSIINLVRDPFLQMWKDYIDHRFSQVSAPTEKLRSINWTQFDIEAKTLIKPYLALSLGNNKAINISADAASSRQALHVPLESVLSKSNTLVSIFRYLYNRTLDSYIAQNITRSTVACARVARSDKAAFSDANFKNLDVAFSSPRLLCDLLSIYGERIRGFSSVYDGFGVNCEEEDGNLDTYGHQTMCRRRYSNVTLMSPNYRRHPLALLSVRSWETVDVRLLFEYSSGFLTGSSITDRGLVNIFKAESFCGNRMSLIYVPSSDVTPIFARNGNPNLSMNSYGRKKCTKGLIRGFSQAVYVVHDPLLAIYERFKLDYPHIANQTMSTSNMSDYVEILVDIAANFKMSYIDPNDELFSGLLRVYKLTQDVMIVSYESLLFSPHRRQLLMNILRFAGFHDLNRQQVNCAFNFVEEDPAKADAVMHAMHFYHLIGKQNRCRIFMSISLFQGIRMPFHRLFEDRAC